ncbi:MAG: hypothetical protein IKH00_01895 [Bacteroidales bacterium]|nr:hypothetical protein [Bacteroidales bacterium]
MPFLILSTAGKFKNITGALNSRISSWTTPKIYYGPENSFCLRPGGSVSFDVSPRLIEGSWQRGPVPVAADVPDAAYVLWGNGSISSAALADGKLTVTASDTPGSALVAIKKGGHHGHHPLVLPHLGNGRGAVRNCSSAAWRAAVFPVGKEV